MAGSDFTVREATRAELADVIPVQHRAFSRVAATLEIDPALMPPIQETEADLHELYDDGTRFFIAVTLAGNVVGAVRATESDVGVHIGRLVVDDGWERLGVATAVMDELEAAYAHAPRLELFTGEQAKAPLSLYLNRGYTEFRREDLGDVVLVWLEKQPDRG